MNSHKEHQRAEKEIEPGGSAQEKIVLAAAIVTGSAGPISSEVVRFFSGKGFDVVGIDNDMRSYFLGREAAPQIRMSRNG